MGRKAESNEDDRLRPEQRELKRLADVLAHERGKVRKLKARLAELEASDASRSSDIGQLYAALTLERNPPELSSEDRIAWLETGARARIRAQACAAGLDLSSSRPRPQGGLFDPPPAAKLPAAPTGQPLRVAITSLASWAFNDCPDPRVIARLIDDPAVEAPDVLVFPRAEGAAYLQDVQRVPEAVWRRVREGHTRLVLDGSCEGHPQDAAVSCGHHAFLEARGAKPCETLFLTQDRRYPEDYQAWSRAEGMEPMRVHVFDAYIGRVFSEFDVSGEQVFSHRLARYLRRPAHRSRRFLSLNYTPRPTKLLFLLRLLRDGLWDQGWISFGGFAATDDGEGVSQAMAVKRLLALAGFEDEVGELLPLVERLAAMPPVLLMAEKFKLHGKQRARSVQALDIEQYDDSWFTVVTETEMSARLHRITEKPLKPLLSFQPFLMLGSPGSLELLRGYGFQTFSPVLDERYDAEPDPRRRFDMVYAEFRRLCALDEAEMARLSAEVCEIVTFNACWGLTELPGRFRRTLVAGLIDQLASPGTPA